MALNLGVTSCQSLEISLDQFVRGEVLEGSNAYYCEKCKEKVLHLPFLENKINLLFICVLRKGNIKLLLLLPLNCVVTCLYMGRRGPWKSLTFVGFCGLISSVEIIGFCFSLENNREKDLH